VKNGFKKAGICSYDVRDVEDIVDIDIPEVVDNEAINLLQGADFNADFY